MPRIVPLDWWFFPLTDSCPWFFPWTNMAICILGICSRSMWKMMMSPRSHGRISAKKHQKYQSKDAFDAANFRGCIFWIYPAPFRNPVTSRWHVGDSSHLILICGCCWVGGEVQSILIDKFSFEEALFLFFFSQGFEICWAHNMFQ